MSKKITFDKAIDYFKQKLPLPTSAWDEIINEAQDWAFTLAGVEKASVLQSVQDLILRVLENKVESVQTYEDFAKNFNDLMIAGGYGEQKPWRTKVVFKQNIRSAYAAGRYKTMSEPEMIRRRPYWQYLHDHPITPRPHHKALDQKIFRATDPIWNSIYPPDGFSCSCSVQSLSERDMKREGLQLSAPLSDRVTLRDRISGQTQSVPAISVPREEFTTGLPPGAIVEGDVVIAPIAEPGFNYIPGASTQEEREEILRNAIARLNPRLQELIEI